MYFKEIYIFIYQLKMTHFDLTFQINNPRRSVQQGNVSPVNISHQ